MFYKEFEEKPRGVVRNAQRLGIDQQTVLHQVFVYANPDYASPGRQFQDEQCLPRHGLHYLRLKSDALLYRRRW